MAKSRTKNVILNSVTGVGAQFLTALMEFLVRTVFIQTLGKTLLGLNGLFSNILTMLSLAELGVGTAILYKLYDPIARHDEHRIAVLMKFYKKMYTIIGLTVAAIGACLIPFIPRLIKNYTHLGLNLTFVYLLFLSRTVTSYLFFAYKSAIIKAHQQQYRLNLIIYFFVILTGIVRIAAMYLVPRFEVYVLISIFFNIMQYYISARVADKMFPFLKEPVNETLSKEEQKAIFKDCGALLIYKINGVVLKGTDNIIISTFLGLETLGMYSNYYLFHKNISTLFQKIFDAFLHSVGNLHAQEHGEKEQTVFSCLHLCTAILGGTGLVGIAVVGDQFIRAWAGSAWVFDTPVALLMGLEIYTLAYRNLLARYRSAYGLFQQAKWRPLFGMIINLVVSLIMVRVWGVCGVLLGTVIADWTTCMWYDPIIIHKYGFHNTDLVKRYFLKYGKYFLSSIASLLLCRRLCGVILPHSGWITVIVHALICGLITPAILLAVSLHTPELEYALRVFRKLSKKLGRKIRK